MICVKPSYGRSSKDRSSIIIPKAYNERVASSSKSLWIRPLVADEAQNSNDRSIFLPNHVYISRKLAKVISITQYMPPRSSAISKRLEIFKSCYHCGNISRASSSVTTTSSIGSCLNSNSSCCPPVRYRGRKMDRFQSKPWLDATQEICHVN